MSLLVAGCASKAPKATEFEKYEYEPEETAPRTDNTATTGSLWQKDGGADKGMYSDIKAYERGDIVTVAIYESASANNEAETNTGRDSSASVSMGSVFGLEERIAKINEGMDPTNLVQTSYENSFDGTGETSREGELQATLTTRVVEVMPDGNLKIQGSKNVSVNNESNIIRLSGIVRPEDIDAGNTVDSKYVLNANIDYKGRGVISDKQSQGWLVRIMDNVWPF
ncbi:MAG: flagellar basal body L-ring protein FlgH [Desulfohalobiaceae bacterium]|nr:flagellar basal body L-ring protein FlgH [Desulfohalobiaceae bacterium]